MGRDKTPSVADVDIDFKEFWAAIVLGPDGNLDPEKVKAELYDYHQLMQNAGRVYTHVTGGRISKLTTDPAVVCNMADGICEDAVEAETIDLRMRIDGLKGKLNDVSYRAQEYLLEIDALKNKCRLCGHSHTGYCPSCPCATFLPTCKCGLCPSCNPDMDEIRRKEKERENSPQRFKE